MSIDVENSLFKEIDKQQIPNLIKRSQFNKIRRKLFLFLEEIRTKLASRFLEFEDYFIVLCRFSNSHVIGELKFVKTTLKLLFQKGFCSSRQLVLRI